MAGQAYPYLAVTIHEVGEFRIGVERVKEIAIGPGMAGTLMVVLTLDECEDCPEAPTTRRFMVPPTGLTFEVGEPFDVPDAPPAPVLHVPPHVAEEQRIKRQK